MEKKHKILVLMGVGIAIAVAMIAIPFASWLSSDLQAVVTTESYWAYPFDDGTIFVITWVAAVESSAQTTICGLCDLTVYASHFVVQDRDSASEWEEVSFWSYLADYYAPNTGPVTPNPDLFAVRITCTYLEEDGTRVMIPVGDNGENERWYSHDEPGVVNGGFTLFTKWDAGAYAFNLSVLIEDDMGGLSVILSEDIELIEIVK